MKVKKRRHVITGLPRSGSTLLTNILNQNPKFHASETSALPRILLNTRAGWENIVENIATPKIETKGHVLKAIAEGYYKSWDREVIFDRSRVWLQEANLAKFVFGEDTKFIICVRDLPEILASFEKLYRKNEAVWDTTDKKTFPDAYTTLTGRCRLWAASKGPVGGPLQSLSEFVQFMPPDSYKFVEFDELTKYPEEEISKIYKFIGEKSFEHDFEHVDNTNIENDMHHGILDLHTTRTEVAPIKKYSKEVLGDLYTTYAGQEFWRNIN